MYARVFGLPVFSLQNFLQNLWTTDTHINASRIFFIMLAHLFCSVLAILLLGPARGTADRRLFGVYVYDGSFIYPGKGTIPSGWNNPEDLGCDPITNATRRAEMLSFLRDPANAVAVAKLTCGPLLKDNATYFAVYTSIVEQLSAAGVAVHLMVSDTPDSFMGYQVDFHSAVDALSEAVPSARVGITYDIEGNLNNAALWKSTYGVMTSYAERAKATRPSTWGGFTFGVPMWPMRMARLYTRKPPQSNGEITLLATMIQSVPRLKTH